MSKKKLKVIKQEPDHYKNSTIEVWEMMLKIWGKDKFIVFCEINAFKYRMRAGEQGQRNN